MSRPSIGSRLDDTNFKLRLALRAAQIGIWDWELESGLMDYSPRARAICGFAPEELVTLDKVRAVTHPDDLPRTSEMARRALDPEQREKAAYEYRIITANTGEVRWVVAHGEAIFTTDGGVTKAVRYVGTLVDITDRKKTELALADSERRQRLAIEAAGMAVWEVDLVADTITNSPELNRIFGLPPNASPSIHELRELYGPGERDRVRQIAQQALAKGEQHFEAEFRSRRGSELCWLLLRAEFMLGPTGQVERVIGVLMDIDARKKAEEKQMLLLRELNHRVKNSLSVVQAIAGQTFRGRAEFGALDDFQARLRALSQANAVLLDADFSAFDLFSLIEGIVAPYRDPPSRITLDGAEIALPPRLNAPLALAIHELCTNAAKYGALSVAGGRVRIVWENKEGVIDLTWSEHGGPPAQDMTHEGFGKRLITRILAPELGHVSLIPSSAGMVCRFLIPV